MSSKNHSIEHEELMAYLDGELATDRAVEAAAHLERCEVCQELAAELRKMSQEMMGWEIEELEPAEDIPIALAAALEERPRVARKPEARGRRRLFTPRRLAWAGGATALVLVALVFFVSRLSLGPQYDFRLREKPQAQVTDGHADAISAQLVSPNEASPSKSLSGYSGSAGKLEKDEDGEANSPEDDSRPEVPEIPMIARTAGLTLVAKEFDKTRASVEEILKRHSGYIGELSVSAPSDAGRTLTATLRIPAPQLEAALAELKQLGRVENESQGGEEVTQEYVDLTARLANAQHTEKRLTEILSSRTGKLQDVLKVELEIDRVRGEIEQMVAQKKELAAGGLRHAQHDRERGISRQIGSYAAFDGKPFSQRGGGWLQHCGRRICPGGFVPAFGRAKPADLGGDIVLPRTVVVEEGEGGVEEEPPARGVVGEVVAGEFIDVSPLRGSLSIPALNPALTRWANFLSRFRR